MKLTRGVHKVSASEAEKLAAEAAAQATTMYLIRGDQAVDCASFFDAVRASLPLNPPIFSSDNWDALSDSIWNGLDESDTNRILIVRSNSDRLKESPKDFETALYVLQDITETIASPELTVGRPKELTVLLT